MPTQIASMSPVFVRWQHYLLGPLVQAGINLVLRPRWSFCNLGPSQMHASNTTIIKTKEDIVSSDAPCYGGELRPVQGMVGRGFELDFAEESFGAFGNQRFLPCSSPSLVVRGRVSTRKTSRV